MTTRGKKKLEATIPEGTCCQQRKSGLTCVLLRDLRRHLTLWVRAGRKQVNAFKEEKKRNGRETEMEVEYYKNTSVHFFFDIALGQVKLVILITSATKNRCCHRVIIQRRFLHVQLVQDHQHPWHRNRKIKRMQWP